MAASARGRVSGQTRARVSERLSHVVAWEPPRWRCGMSIKVEPISGFPEWLPHERLAEERFIDTIRRQYQLFGFTPIETPAVERLDVLTAKGGMQRQIFTLGRPQEGAAEAELGLHFDLTVPLARYVVQHAEGLTFP